MNQDSHDGDGDGSDLKGKMVRPFSGPGIAKAKRRPRYEIQGGGKDYPTSFYLSTMLEASGLPEGACIVRDTDGAVVAVWLLKCKSREGKCLGEWVLTSDGLSSCKVA